MSSRFYASDDWDDDAVLRYGRWIARTKAVVNGRPAQQFFKELEVALLALPRKRLIAGSLCNGEDVCALGALFTNRGEPVDELELTQRCLNENDSYYLDDATARYSSAVLGMTYTLAWMIAEANDETYRGLTPENRYHAMLQWARSHLHS